MRRDVSDCNSRHHTEMHGCIEGSIVFEIDDRRKTERTVVAIGGLYKDDHLQLDSHKGEWVIAKYFRKV